MLSTADRTPRELRQSKSKQGDERQQHTLTFPTEHLHPIYTTLKLQINHGMLGCCLLIVGGSLDGLPDPPAVKPQGIPEQTGFPK
jgi:hypothetical protein